MRIKYEQLTINQSGMKSKSSILILALMLFATSLAEGQKYGNMAGIRSGYRSGLFYQATRKTGNAETGFQAMVSFSNDGMQVNGLRIIYSPPLDEISPSLYLAWGYGGHAGFFYSDHFRFLGDTYNYPEYRLYPVIGIDGWLSAEYRIREVPINISLNVKPYLEVSKPPFVRVNPADVGISVAYVF
jgi:hypothetical protein